MSSLLQTVRRLVALAGSLATPEEEARTAAVKACRLIIENKLIVADESMLDESNERPPNYDPKDVFQRIRHEAAVAASRGSKKAETALQRIRAKRGSVCRVCGGPYLKGEEIAWKKGMSSGIHLRCSSLNATNGNARQEGFKF